MARTKQAAPLRREPSDFEYERPKSSNHNSKHANGNTPKAPFTTSNGKPKGPVPSTAKEQAGLPQLAVCVGGIYISL